MNDASHSAAEYRFLDWRYEPARRRLVGPAGEVRLKPLSDRLLRCLLDAPGTVRARDQLIEEVWTRREVNDEVLSRAIAELRALLGDDARQPRFVETLSKGGYRWIAAVTRIDAARVPVRESISQRSAVPANRRWIAGIAVALVLVGLAAWFYAQRKDGSGDHAALAVDLLAARPLAADARLEYDARFDGVGRVVYVRSDQDSEASELVLIDTASLAERVLWREPASLRDPAPSPDGREVAVMRRDKEVCEVWSVALVDLHRSRLGNCAPSGAGGLEWADGGKALLYTGAAVDTQHAPGLVLLDRSTGAEHVLTTPEIGEGAHVDPRLSRDGTRLVYASMRDGEAQLWQTDWPGLKQRNALLKRPEPLYGHAFEANGDALWVAGDLTLYRALHRLRNGGEPELIGGRGAISIDIARDGAAVWSEANYDADIWLRDSADAPWTAIARSNGYESQPEFSADGSRLALVSNRNGVESIFVYDRRDGSVRPLPLEPRLRWVRPSWSARDQSLILTAYEDRNTRLYRYRLDDDAARAVPHVEQGAFAGVELADRLLYMTGNGTGRGTLMQLRDGQTNAEDVGLGSVSAFRVSREWLVWRSEGSSTLHAAPWPALRPVRDIAVDEHGEDFALTGNALYFVDGGNLRTLSLPDGEPIEVVEQRVPSGNGPTLAASADGALAVVTLTSLSIDLMIADRVGDVGKR
jgi:DNA-binding winged helix-turn-helix (wHTH) protein/Tol biopolymer transport system component